MIPFELLIHPAGTVTGAVRWRFSCDSRHSPQCGFPSGLFGVHQACWWVSKVSVPLRYQEWERSVSVEVRRKFVGVGPLLPPCGFEGLKPGCQAWQQTSLSPGPVYWLRTASCLTPGSGNGHNIAAAAFCWLNSLVIVISQTHGHCLVTVRITYCYRAQLPLVAALKQDCREGAGS